MNSPLKHETFVLAGEVSLCMLVDPGLLSAVRPPRIYSSGTGQN